MNESHSAIVVGAGQAGLAASYHLKQLGIEHVLLDRGRPGETWRTQRWDSFVLNTPSLANSLPGKPFYPDTPRSFESNANLIAYFEQYATEMDLPLRTGVEVNSATRAADGESIKLKTSNGTYTTKNLIAASGGQNVPIYPRGAENTPSNILSLHGGSYRNPAQLPDGATLVVASAQTGIQLAEEIQEAGRKTYLSTSKVGRFRRQFRGSDVVQWMIKAGLMAHTPPSLENPEDMFNTQPIASGVDGGKTVSLQALWQSGVNLLGRFERFEGSTAVFRDDLRENIEFADTFSAKFFGNINNLAEKEGAPPIENDPSNDVDPEALAINEPTHLDLVEAGITSIIWTTGFNGDYSWIDLEGHAVERNRPVQTDGASPAKGLYFIGSPWVRTRASGILYGVGDDAEAIAIAIANSIDR
jgi:putative flavoprotein involved in K+ transport